MAKEDMAAPGEVRRPGKVGSRFLLVDGTMYGVDPEDGGWVVLGSPDSIDPDSGRIVREIAVTWGSGALAWSYTVAYHRLDATPAPVVPADARPLRERPRAGEARTAPGGPAGR